MIRHRRLALIVRALLAADEVTAEALAERFDVSVRTIYRDMAELSRSGLPLTGYSGVGYRLDNGPTVAVTLSVREIKALVGAGDRAEPARSLDRARHRLLDALPGALRAAIELGEAA